MLKSFITVVTILFSISAYSATSTLPGGPMIGDLGAVAGKNDKTRMIIITTKGYVSFEVENDWSILGAKTKPPVGSMAFQLHNTADKGTPDSTNLSVSFFTEDSEQAKPAIAKVGKKYGNDEVKTEKYKDWIVYTQQVPQKETLYTMYDAKKKVTDVLVAVRIAWPHLPKNSANYDKDMQSAFYSVLDSVEGKAEAYRAQGNELFRRPN
jgi:hypothetical protein